VRSERGKVAVGVEASDVGASLRAEGLLGLRPAAAGQGRASVTRHMRAVSWWWPGTARARMQTSCFLAPPPQPPRAPRRTRRHSASPRLTSTSTRTRCPQRCWAGSSRGRSG
jgi:hypothetical protein